MVEEHKTPRGKRGSGRKTAPPGYYTAKEAAHILGLEKYQFYRNIGEKGLQITRVVLPGYTEGVYKKEQIDELAQIQEVTMGDERALPSIRFRVATAADAEGIAAVLRSLGWGTVDPEERKWRFAINPEMDHVVIRRVGSKEMIMGYVNTMFLTKEAMEWMVSAHGPDGNEFKSWMLRPQDFLPLIPGQHYDIFFGMAVRGKPGLRNQYEQYGLKLALDLRTILLEWARRSIFIDRMLAHTEEGDGLELAKTLGFTYTPVPGDRYPRYVLDLHTTKKYIWKEYQQVAFSPPS